MKLYIDNFDADKELKTIANTAGTPVSSLEVLIRSSIWGIVWLGLFCTMLIVYLMTSLDLVAWILFVFIIISILFFPAFVTLSLLNHPWIFDSDKDTAKIITKLREVYRKRLIAKASSLITVPEAHPTYDDVRRREIFYLAKLDLEIADSRKQSFNRGYIISNFYLFFFTFIELLAVKDTPSFLKSLLKITPLFNDFVGKLISQLRDVSHYEYYGLALIILSFISSLKFTNHFRDYFIIKAVVGSVVDEHTP